MIQELGGHALAVRCDVSLAEDVQRALNATIETFGRLDFAFNNAGIEYTIKPAADVTEEEWDRIIDIDLRGVFLCMKYEIPLILKQGGGAIVNTSSGAGVKGFKGGAAYVAAKHGVVGLTKSAALDYAPSNIRINAVCPGIIDTPMMDRFSGGTAEGRQAVITQEPVGRMGKPEEIAATVVWLCSDTASFVVGHAMIVEVDSAKQLPENTGDDNTLLLLDRSMVLMQLDQYELSSREVLGFGGTQGYDSTLNGKVLDLAIREAVNRLVEGVEQGKWTPARN